MRLALTVLVAASQLAVIVDARNPGLYRAGDIKAVPACPGPDETMPVARKHVIAHDDSGVVKALGGGRFHPGQINVGDLVSVFKEGVGGARKQAEGHVVFPGDDPGIVNHRRYRENNSFGRVIEDLVSPAVADE